MGYLARNVPDPKSEEKGNVMARKEIAAQPQSDKKLRTRDLIYAGAFGAIYLVVMLAIVMASGMVPVLYLVAPLTVGVVCGTIYEMCVLKVHKFGAALILGVLFALVTCSSNIIGAILAVAAALLAELIIYLGKYKSKKHYLASFVAFNINMACPYTMLLLAYDDFMVRAVEWYGQDYADGLAAVTFDGVWFLILGFAILGGIIGAAVASKLIAKHFEKARIL